MIEYWTALSIGLLGSLHCIGMCGPIAFALPLDRNNSFNVLIGNATYNLGRLLMYFLLGAFLGSIGKGFVLVGAQQWLSIAVGILIIFSVFLPLINRKSWGFLLIGGLFGRIKQSMAKRFGRKSNTNLLLIGLLNGLLPCGLVYMGLAGSTAMANSLKGGIFMFFFGLGTLPLMLAIGVYGKPSSTTFSCTITKTYSCLCSTYWSLVYPERTEPWNSLYQPSDRTRSNNYKMPLSMYWEALDRNSINREIDEALASNANYSKGEVMGTPATYLDNKEFYPDASFLSDAPYLKTLIANPNHIGCHTLSKNSSPLFKGTQTIERRLIQLCAQEIFKSPENKIDGYVATGGTEANLQAMWIYRNYFLKEYHASVSQIGVLFSEDTHYSIYKGCDLLQLTPIEVKVNEEDRSLNKEQIAAQLELAVKSGIKYFIIVVNVSTTMYGSVDEISPLVDLLEDFQLLYKLHLDAAFGGFIYPFTNVNSEHNFENPAVSSISIDGHKMLQTPYGTGIFLIRKGFMKYVTNDNALYVPGLDYTLCGSRSGANAIVTWMILMSYGSEGWKKKMKDLIDRTNFLCAQLRTLGYSFYRNPYLNIVTIQANQLNTAVAHKYELVADTYESHPSWWKIVVMDHVNYELLERFFRRLKKA